MSNKLDFERILIISPNSKRCQVLASALRKHLLRPEFTFLHPVVDSLPDHRFNWSDIDLMMVDLSGNKRAIYQWYSKNGISNYLAPAIFLANPASYSDAGSFYRAGASNYLELRGLKIGLLRHALSIVASSMEKKREAEPVIKQSNNQGIKGNPFSLDLTKTIAEEQPPTTNTDGGKHMKTRPEFVNTGVMNILDREELKRRTENKLARNSDSE